MGDIEKVLTRKERILLFLNEFKYHKEDYIAPFEICQKGIAEILGIYQSNISKEITKLEEEGLIESKLARIEGAERKRNVYCLTEEGKNIVKKLLSNLRKNKIKVKNKKVTKKSVSEVLNTLQKDYPSINAFYIEEWMRNKDVFDFEEFEPPFDSRKKVTIDMIMDAPLIEDFYDRREELKRLKKLLENDIPPVIILFGIPGIGKSYLGSKFMSELKGRKDIFWYTFNRWDTLSDLKESLNEYSKKGNLSPIKKDSNLTKFVSRFINNISELDPIFFFDNYENVNSEQKDFLKALLDYKRKGEDFDVIVLSRVKPDFYDVRDVMKDVVHEEKLSGFKKDQLKEFIDKENIEDIYKTTKGHPLHLKLYKKHGGVNQKMEDFLDDEIYIKLDPGSKKLLKKLSVLWGPLKKDIILDEKEDETLIELKEKNFIQETQDGSIALHNVLKDYFYQKMTKNEKKKYHSMVGETLDKSHIEERNLEALFHYEKAGEGKKAVNKLGNLLYQLSSMEEKTIIEFISDFPLEELSREEESQFYETLGDIFLEKEKAERAVENYRKAKDLGEKRPVLEEKIREIENKLKKWSKTEEKHENEIKEKLSKNDYEGAAKELISLGKLYRNREEYKKSKECYSKVEKLLDQTDIENLKGTLFNNLGLLYLCKNDFERAEKYFKKSLKETKCPEIVNENLSRLYEESGDTEKSLKFLNKTISEYRELKRYDKVSKLLIKKSDILLRADRIEESEETLEEALNNEKKRKIPIINRKDSLSQKEMKIHQKLAILQEEKGELKDCINHRKKVIESLKKSNKIERAGKVSFKLAFNLKDSGNSEEAITLLDHWENILKENDIETGSAVCKYGKAKIYSDMGSYQKAVKEIEKIKFESEKIDNMRVLRDLSDLGHNIYKKMGKPDKAEEIKHL